MNESQLGWRSRKWLLLTGLVAVASAGVSLFPAWEVSMHPPTLHANQLASAQYQGGGSRFNHILLTLSSASNVHSSCCVSYML